VIDKRKKRLGNSIGCDKRTVPSVPRQGMIEEGKKRERIMRWGGKKKRTMKVSYAF